MVIVTKILKRTVGEDNEKTEVFMTANRSVTRGLTSSAVISVSLKDQDKRDPILIAATVLAVEYCNAWIILGGISIWRLGSILVRSRMQPDDCLLRSPRYLLQAENPRSAHSAGDCQNPLW